MLSFGSNLQRGWALGLTLLMLTLSGAVPLMERADVNSVPVAESEHSPADCPQGHDHTVCTQVGANLSAVVDAAHDVPAPAVTRAALLVTISTVAAAAFDAGHRSRAPPSV